MEKQDKFLPVFFNKKRDIYAYPWILEVSGDGVDVPLYKDFA